MAAYHSVVMDWQPILNSSIKSIILRGEQHGASNDDNWWSY
jgi:hypothetical protein